MVLVEFLSNETSASRIIKVYKEVFYMYSWFQTIKAVHLKK